MEENKPTKRIVGRPFEKGNKGKPKGTLNKLPVAIATTVKETVLQAFQILQEDPNHNLVSFAKRYPRDFYAIAAKLIPSEVNATVTRSQDIKFVFVEDTECEPLLGDSGQDTLPGSNSHQDTLPGNHGHQDLIIINSASLPIDQARPPGNQDTPPGNQDTPPGNQDPSHQDTPPGNQDTPPGN